MVRLNVTAASTKSTDTDADDDDGDEAADDADDGADADEWTVDCTALVDVDLACALCAPLVPAANSRQLMSTTALVVCLTAGALVTLLVAVGVFCRRITSTRKHACTYVCPTSHPSKYTGTLFTIGRTTDVSQ